MNDDVPRDSEFPSDVTTTMSKRFTHMRHGNLPVRLRLFGVMLPGVNACRFMLEDGGLAYASG
jgi:hypothetical protein